MGDLRLSRGLSLTGAFLTKKTNQVCFVMVALVIPNLIATILLICITPSDSTKGGLIVVFYFTQFFQVSAAPSYARHLAHAACRRPIL